MAVLLWVAGATVAQATDIHRRGDYQFEVGPAPAFVQTTPLPDKWDPGAAGADDKRWRYWRYDLQSDRRGGRDEVYVDYAYEAMSPAHLGDAGRFKVSFNPDYQRLVIHRADLRRDGQWTPRLDVQKVSLARRETGFENNLSDGVVTALIVLDDVRVGDVVRISYTVQGSNPVMAGDISDWINFAWTNPMLEARVRVLMDAGKRPRIFRDKGAPEPVIRNTGGGVEVVMQARAVAPIVHEGGYPVWYQPYPQAQIAVDRSWGDVVAWGLPLYPAVDQLPAELEALLAEWRGMASDQQRITAALRAVQDQVRYFGVEMGENTHRPTAPALTWQRRYGDCKDKTYLLVTLLQRLGIDAVPALVSVENGRAIADYVPSASDFDHVIVRAKHDGRTMWLDPTMTQQGGDPATVDLSEYGMVLPLEAGNASLQAVAAPAEVARGTTVRERYEIAKGGGVQLSIQTEFVGEAANRARVAIGSERNEELARRYSDYYRKRFGELTVVSAASMQDDRSANRINLSETYLLKSPLQDVGANKALDLFAESLQSVAALPASVERNGPLHFADPGEYRHEIKVTYPPEWKPAFMDETSTHSSSAFDYQRKLTVGTGQVDVHYAMTVKQRELDAAAAPAHIDQLRLAREDLSSRLSFSRASQAGGKEREQRIRNLLRDIGQDDKEGTPE